MVVVFLSTLQRGRLYKLFGETLMRGELNSLGVVLATSKVQGSLLTAKRHSELHGHVGTPLQSSKFIIHSGEADMICLYREMC